MSYAELLTALQWEREHNQDLSNQLLPVLRNLDSRGLEPLMRTNQELAANNKNLSQEINTLRHQTGGSAGYTDQRRAPRIRRKFAPRLNTVREERDAALQQENIRLKENVRISRL